LFSDKTNNNSTKYGLVYDLETDKFVPIKKWSWLNQSL
jgi:hypothetical protein